MDIPIIGQGMTEAEAKEIAELDAGWDVRFERDPADPRFVTFTCRHPYDADQEVPPSATGVEAQVHTVAFAVTICAQQGIVPPQLAMRILESCQQQIAEVRAQASPIITPPPVV